MKISYDYGEFLQEFKEEIEDNILDKESYIWIIRAENPVYADYYPIIDWYYLDDLKNDETDSMDKVRAKKRQLGAVLSEMLDVNDIFKGI